MGAELLGDAVAAINIMFAFAIIFGPDFSDDKRKLIGIQLVLLVLQIACYQAWS